MRCNPTETGCQRPSGGRKSGPAGGNAIDGSKLEPVRLPSGLKLGVIWGMSVKIDA